MRSYYTVNENGEVIKITVGEVSEDAKDAMARYEKRKKDKIEWEKENPGKSWDEQCNLEEAYEKWARETIRNAPPLKISDINKYLE